MHILRKEKNETSGEFVLKDPPPPRLSSQGRVLVKGCLSRDPTGVAGWKGWSCVLALDHSGCREEGGRRPVREPPGLGGDAEAGVGRAQRTRASE